MMKRIIKSLKLMCLGSFFVVCRFEPLFAQEPILFRGDLSPVNAVYAITRPGVYQLTSAKTASAVPNISITANNVLLDLGGNTLSGGTNGIEMIGNNIMVKNGTITGMAQNGVLVQGNGCQIENCDVVVCTTGITLQSSHECMVKNCRIRQATQAGIELMSSWTNSMHACEVMNIHGVASVYGVIATHGGINTIEQCAVRDVQTSSSTGSDTVVGIALSNEVASSVHASTIQAIESLTTVSAYGIMLDGGNNGELINNNVAQVGTSNGSGQGVFVNQSNSYVAGNTVYDCDSSFTGVSTQYITSQANDRGVYNIDTNLATPDTVAVMYDDQLPLMQSQLDVLPDSVFTVESKLDYLTVFEPTVVTAAGTLSSDYGLYCLGNDITGQLSITGTGIDFDLCDRMITANGTNGLVISGNDVAVRNGTVRNASASGVNITGSNCILDHVTSYGNVTGFELSQADRTSLTNCFALNNTREGYLLSSSDHNTFDTCHAVNTNGAAVSVGIRTNDGVGNQFKNCDINGVASSAAEAYGILAQHEQKSMVTDCTINGVSGQRYVAGIGVQGDYVATPTMQDFVKNAARISLSIDWLNTPVGSYIATQGSTAPNANIRINLLSAAGFYGTDYTGGSFGVTGCRTRWLTWNNAYYVAMSGINGAASGKIYVYSFEPFAGLSTGTLTEVANFTDAVNAQCVGLSWVISGTRPYLFYTRVTNASSAEFGVFEFGGTSLTLRSSIEYAGDYPKNINPHVIHGIWKVAVTGVTGTDATPLIRLYTFDNPQGAKNLTLATSYDIATAGSASYSGSWLDYAGEIYYAIAIDDNTSTPTVRVLKYTDSPESLDLFATYNYNAAAQSVDWLVTGTSVYLAVSGNKTNGRVEVLKFDPYQGSVTTRLSSYSVVSGENQQGYETRWNRIAETSNRVYLGVAKSGTASTPYLRVYGFGINNQSELCLLEDNVVFDITGGTGILADTVINGAIENKAYNCQDGLVEGVRTSYPGTPFESSNWQVPHA